MYETKTTLNVWDVMKRMQERKKLREKGERPSQWVTSTDYKIAKIVRALSLAESRVCMKVCKHGYDVKIFCFSRANLKKFLSSKQDKVTLFTHSFLGWNLENLYQPRSQGSLLPTLQSERERESLENAGHMAPEQN